ncbi:hypothetical protein LPB72_21730 [Hydrogenophaga crassostreae]|uniref:Uncharacterized protein n=2 Tax=Hydrogenophaga crassostreae TaxID=1763535 RepID=A0A167GBK4_9BURK|nr:hypothetical protein LPB072_22345 [Hydrogenophaga crassostreae]OAD39228.1 hypothetical protein LPB72_21730 [Hydrogenophaga crassostreae]
MAMALVAALLLILLPLSAQAQTFKLDDSTSPRSRVVPRFIVDEAGNTWGRAIEADHAVLRYGQVVYRLDMRPHLGQRARIYFVRELQNGPPNGTRLNWKTADGQLSGSLLSGERALVWSGKVSQPWMELPLLLEIDINLQRWSPQAGRSGIAQVTYFELERQP